jgi:hypothetical protein
MKTHELKLDIKYFDDVKAGKMKFDIHKNDHDFEVGDILDLKAYDARVGYMKMDTKTLLDEHFAEVEKTAWFKVKSSKSADILRARVTCILSSMEVNEGIDFMNFKPEVSLFEDEALPFMKAGWRLDWDYEYFLKVLKNFSHSDKLPDGYVILGIEVLK